MLMKLQSPQCQATNQASAIWISLSGAACVGFSSRRPALSYDIYLLCHIFALYVNDLPLYLCVSFGIIVVVQLTSGVENGRS